MKQYILKKPVRSGFKVWVIADSSNGYFLDVDVYVCEYMLRARGTGRQSHIAGKSTNRTSVA